MGTMNFLQPDGPRVEIFSNMNTAYIRLDQNLVHDDDFLFIKVAFTAIIEDESGDIFTPEDGQQSYLVPKYNLWNPTTGPELPDYNLEIDIQNRIYLFEFSFIYDYPDTPEGSTHFTSALTHVRLDNRETILNSKITNENFRGQFLDLIQNTDNFTIFYNIDPDEDLTEFQIGDVVVSHNGLILRQITGINQNKPLFSECSPDYFNGVYYLINHPSLPRIMFENFDGVSGTGTLGNLHEFIFKAILNRQLYTIKMYGNYNNLIDKYKEEGNQNG